jgi:porphobilinogen synthase
MMDGRIGRHPRGAGRGELTEVPILSYAAKYASGFYGPFREAAQSTPPVRRSRGYQMDPANAREALKEVQTGPRGGRGHDHGEARAVLPGHHPPVRERVDVPVVAYNVSPSTRW